MRGWPRRRWAALVAALPVLAVLFDAVGASSVGGSPWWAWPLVAVDALLAATVLSSYVPAPGSGRLVDVGCSPCATVAGLTVVLALMARSAAPADATMGAISALLLLAGVRQRLGDATACATGAGG